MFSEENVMLVARQLQNSGINATKLENLKIQNIFEEILIQAIAPIFLLKPITPMHHSSITTKRYLKPCQTSKKKLYAKIYGKGSYYFCKELNLRCATVF